MTARAHAAHILFAGLTTFDVVQYYREPPAWGAKGTAEDSCADVGGPAANAAVTAALLGASARLVTAIGGGTVADIVRSRLQELGVDLVDVAAGETELPVSSIWVDRATGSRTVISTNRAPAAQEGLASAVAGALDGATVAVLVDGHHPAICETVVQQAADAGVPIVLDGGSWKPVLERVLPHVSVAILSQDFALPASETAGFELAGELRDRFGVEEVAITRGAGAILSLAHGVREEIAVPRVRAVDTLGAGDVFHGAYIFFRHLAGRGHGEALERAARVASASCAHVGTRAGVREVARELA